MEKPLEIRESENIQTMIMELIKKFDGYPKGFIANEKNVKWNSTADKTSIGVFPLPGAIYLKKYINGSYKAQFPFQIAYKSNPTCNSAGIKAQTVLEKLGQYLEECMPAVSDKHIKIEKISRMSVVGTTSISENETVNYINMQLKYYYKED